MHFRKYWYLAKSFLLIGSISFGGYLALIGIVRDKLVLKDQVIEEDRITEAIALASLLPGPLAVNVVGYIGYGIAGIVGAIVSIVSVLFPSYLLLLTLSVLYFEFNSLLDFDSILMGIIPVIIGVILSMAVGMWKKNCTNSKEIVIAVLSLASLFFFNSYWTIVCVILLSGVVGIFLFNKGASPQNLPVKMELRKYTAIVAVMILVYLLGALFFTGSINFELFHNFATASLTLFGGGYVMIPVLNVLLVEQLQWVNTSEFFLGISLGQVTPGPILISAVFFGYKVNGVMGSIFAALGIFLPSSLLMILASKFYSQISKNHSIVSALRGVKPAIVGLIIYSAFSLALSNNTYDNKAYIIPLILLAFLVLQKYKLSPVFAVILGGIAGYLVHLI